MKTSTNNEVVNNGSKRDLNEGNVKTCTKHRVILKSSELVYPSKYEFGEPIGNKCVFTCLSCGYTHELLFKGI